MSSFRSWSVVLAMLPFLGASAAAKVPKQVEEAVARSRVQTLRGEWDQAVSSLERRIVSAERQKDRESEAVLRAELGRVLADRSFFYRSDAERAERALQKARSVSEAIGDRSSLATALHNLGRLRYADALGGGDFEPSRPFFTRARDLREQVGDAAALSDSLFHLGLIEQMQGRSAEARVLFERSLALATSAGDKVMQSYALRHLAWLDQVDGKLGEATKGFERSLALRREAGFTVGTPFALMPLADLAAAHDRPRAVELLEEAIALAAKHNSPRARYAAQLQLAELYLSGEEPARAVRYARQALAGARAFGHPPDVAAAEQVLAKAQEPSPAAKQ